MKIPVPAAAPWRAILAVVLISVLAPSGVRSQSPEPVASPLPRRLTLELTGELIPRQQVKVIPRVSGLLTKVMFREGTPFRKDQVMAELDRREFELAVQEARANVAAAEAQLRAMLAGGRPEERSRSAADVEAAAAVHNNARQIFVRLSGLHAKGGISRQELDAARRELDVAEARLTSAKKGLAIVQQGPRPEDKDVGRASVARAQATLDQALLRLEYTNVRAPFDGTIGQRLVDEGSAVTGGTSPQATPICVYSDGSVLKAILDVPESDLPYIRVGKPAKISVRARPDRTFPGKISNVYPFVDPKTRSGKIELEVPNLPPRLTPGMFVKALIEVSSDPADSALEVLGARLPGASGTTTDH